MASLPSVRSKPAHVQSSDGVPQIETLPVRIRAAAAPGSLPSRACPSFPTRISEFSSSDDARRPMSPCSVFLSEAPSSRGARRAFQGAFLITSRSFRVEFFPTDGEPTEIPVSEELLDFLRKHGTPVGWIGSGEPRFIVYQVAQPLKLAASGLPQPLVQLLLSLIAGYGDGRLVQSADE